MLLPKNADMLIKQLAIKDAPKLLDATDALGVAVCHYYSGGKQVRSSKSWASFVADNPDRVK